VGPRLKVSAWVRGEERERNNCHSPEKGNLLPHGMSFPRKRLCHNTYFGETEKLKILIKEVGLEEKL
jgi:hypothetical protein